MLFRTREKKTSTSSHTRRTLGYSSSAVVWTLKDESANNLAGEQPSAFWFMLIEAANQAHSPQTLSRPVVTYSSLPYLLDSATEQKTVEEVKWREHTYALNDWYQKVRPQRDTPGRHAPLPVIRSHLLCHMPAGLLKGRKHLAFVRSCQQGDIFDENPCSKSRATQALSPSVFPTPSGGGENDCMICLCSPPLSFLILNFADTDISYVD